MQKINLNKKFDLIDDHWHPRVVGALNGQEVRLAKVKGEFVWHSHADEDEMFYVVRGELRIEFRDRVEELSAGDLLIVPRGVEHRPVAEEEAWLMLLEPATTLHTGEVRDALTVDQMEWI